MNENNEPEENQRILFKQLLLLDQRIVHATRLHQLSVRALLHNFPVLNNSNAVRILYRRQPVCNNQSRHTVARSAPHNNQHKKSAGKTIKIASTPQSQAKGTAATE